MLYNILMKIRRHFSLGLLSVWLAGCAQIPEPPAYTPPPPPPITVVHTRQFKSAYLEESQRWAVYLPEREGLADLPLIIMFDGQNNERLLALQTLDKLWSQQGFKPFALVALWAGPARLDNYGIPGRPDYQGRGSRGEAFGRFLLEEFLPELEKNYPITKDPRHRYMIGFSFTGLGALAQVLHKPDRWGGAAVMSGSFWWRSGEDAQQTRIILDVIRNLPAFPRVHRFWLMAGDAEETSDRDNDGIIDVVDDTLDVLAGLKSKGYPENLLSYRLVPGGRHHESTWAAHLGDAIRWLLVDQP